jgi:hypothetical protein
MSCKSVVNVWSVKDAAFYLCVNPCCASFWRGQWTNSHLWPHRAFYTPGTEFRNLPCTDIHKHYGSPPNTSCELFPPPSKTRFSVFINVTRMNLLRYLNLGLSYSGASRTNWFVRHQSFCVPHAPHEPFLLKLPAGAV